jgi:serine/threonine protein kinase
VINTLVGDHFLIEQELGRDQFGIVYIGRDTRWRREVKPIAIRILDKRLCMLPGFAERLAEIAPKLASWDQLYINRVIAQGVMRDVQSGATLHYLVNEPPGTETLYAYVQRVRSQLSPDLVAVLIEQIAAALEYANRQNIIHGNLNLWNITMRERNGAASVEVTDFGLVQLLTPFSQKEHEQMIGWKVPAGIPEFIAPERFRGEPPSKSNDVYDFGVILYFILSGRYPFTGSYDQLILAHSYQNPPSLGPLVPHGPEIHTMMIRLLSKAPLDRMSVQDVCIRYRQINNLPRTMLPVFDSHSPLLTPPPGDTGDLKKKGGWFGRS